MKCVFVGKEVVSDSLKARAEKKLSKLDRYFNKEAEAIIRFRQQLVEAGTFTDEEIDALDKEAEKIINDTVEYAKAQPQPELSDLETDVYAD